MAYEDNKTKSLDRCAPECDDQLPVIATVGRGPKGNSCHIEISDPDTCTETYLHGWETDSTTGEILSEWTSNNINGGELSYRYKLNPVTDPPTFNITFEYKRPGRCEWTFTTPNIPYVFSEGGGIPEGMSAGVQTLFLKKVADTTWKEKLIYPDGKSGKDYNAPNANEAWTVSLTYGPGGDIDVPGIADLAKMIGITEADLRKWLAGNPIIISGTSYANLIEYIMSHLHKDLGFDLTDGHGYTNSFGERRNADGTTKITSYPNQHNQKDVQAYIDCEVAKAKRFNIFRTVRSEGPLSFQRKIYVDEDKTLGDMIDGWYDEQGHLVTPILDCSTNFKVAPTFRSLTIDPDDDEAIQTWPIPGVGGLSETNLTSIPCEAIVSVCVNEDIELSKAQIETYWRGVFVGIPMRERGLVAPRFPGVWYDIPKYPHDSPYPDLPFYSNGLKYPPMIYDNEHKTLVPAAPECRWLHRTVSLTETFSFTMTINEWGLILLENIKILTDENSIKIKKGHMITSTFISNYNVFTIPEKSA